MCIFSSEEIGSLTKDGADSSFLIDTLKRISGSINSDISISLHNSLIVSADNSHAVHPNHPNKSDINNQGFFNKGILIVREKDTTTDSISSTISISGFTIVAIENASFAVIPEEKFLTGTSKKSLNSEKSTISSNFSSKNCFE